MSAKAYQAPSTNEVAEATPTPAPPTTKKPPQKQSPGSVDAISGSKGVVLQGNGKQITVHGNDQPINEVVDFYQKRLAELGLRIVSANSGASQIFIIAGSGKNAKIVIASQNENRTVVQIAYDEE
jgi:hypothetical protein